MKRFSILILFLYIGLFLWAGDRHSSNVLTGTVTCNGRGVPGVVVTDGTRCVTTDKKGVYKLPVQGDARFVYLSTPAGYLTECDRTIPRFYQEIEPGKYRHYDFYLTKNPKDDTRHLFVLEADVQAGLPEHWKQYAPIVEEISGLAKEHSQKDVFGLNCGDIFWDTPLKSFPDYMTQAEKLGFPVFRSIGNHDIDTHGRTHETSYHTFESFFGPTHYSFNKGKAHYIVINNNFYVGRDYFYIGYFDEQTLKWMEADLSYVPQGTLLFVICHIPTRVTEKERPFGYDYMRLGGETTNAGALHRMLDKYETHFLSGHLHSNANIVFSERHMEHNTAAVCGIWWHGDVCVDGTPRGYGVYEIDGNQVTWYYKGAGHPRDYQFRAYPVGTSQQFPKDVIANVWNWDKAWKVEWLEDGKPMGAMVQYTGIDPYADQVCTEKRKTIQGWIAAASTNHLFRATPTRADAEIEIQVTDRFGQVYRQKISK